MTVPKNAPEGDFALPPDGLYVGDAHHAALAVQAVTSGLEGNVAKVPADKEAGVHARIAAAIRKFYAGAEQDYYLTWLRTGKKPDEKPVKEFRLPTPAFSFQGDIVDVPLSPCVDYDALIAIPCPACKGVGCPACNESGSIPDPKPLFVVRPLGKLAETSDNNLYYDQELLDQIREAIHVSSRPGGQGHVSETAINYEFADDVALWVGATQIGDTLYGKAFIYPSKFFHEMVIRRKAAGGTLSNSIFGKGRFITHADGTLRLRELRLESIDFAPPERAAVEALGGDIQTTTEMNKGAGDMSDHDHDDIATHVKEMAPHALHEIMTHEQRQHCTEMHLREMEPNSVYEMLPKEHKQHIAECYAKEFGQKMAAEMSSDPKFKALSTQVSEMQSTIAEYRQREFDAALDAAAAKPFSTWQVQTPNGKEGIASAVTNFEMFIVAEMAAMSGGQTIANIPAAAEKAWPKYEPQAALLKIAVTGGNVITGMVSETKQSAAYGWDEKTQRYTDDAVARNRAKVSPTGGY